MTYGNGLKRVLAQDTDGRLTSLNTSNGTTDLQNLTYTYNTNNAITKITNSVISGMTLDFQYDALNRLHYYASGYNDNWTYSLDANGNRTSAVLGGKSSRTDSYTVSTTSNHLTGISVGQTVSYGYNAVGDITSGGANSYGYDPFGRMISLTRSGTTYTYSYNAFNERVWKSVPEAV